MPTLIELTTLFDPDKTNKSDNGHDVHLTELIRLTWSWTWASETRGSDAALVNFLLGRQGWIRQTTIGRVLPVRSGK
jgi:hypothetical protein